MSTIETQHEMTILTRVIAPSDGSLNDEVATSLLALRFPESDVERMNELAEKNRQNEVSDEEREEMESYSRVGNLLNLLQSKARQSLRHG